MNIGLVILVLLILLLIGVFPAWPYSSGWGHGPVSIVSVLVIILLVLLLTGRL